MNDAHEGRAPEAPPSLREIRQRYFGPLLAFLLLLRLAVLVVRLAGIIPSYPDISFPEGALVARAMDVAQGETPYHDWRQWPHAFAPYPPLAYYPAGWLARGIWGRPSPHEAYMTGRAICFAAMLGIGALVYLLARRLGLGRLWGLLAVSVLVEAPALMEYSVSFRPDAPKTFFALLALLIADCGMRNAEYEDAEREASDGFAMWVVGTLGCLLVSAWFKPTAWGIGALILFSVWRRLGLKRGALATGAFLASGILPLLCLNHHWHGLLLLNLVDSLRNGATLDQVRNLLTPGDLRFQCVLLAGVVGSLFALRREDQRAHGLFWAAPPVVFAVTLLQMLKVGADINYTLESFALGAVAAAWWAARWWRGEASGSSRQSDSDSIRNPQSAIRNLLVSPRLREAALWLALIPALLWGAWKGLSTLRDDVAGVRLLWTPPPVLRMVAGSPGPILSTKPFVALAAPSPTVLDYYQYAVLWRRGALSSEPLLERIRRREFPVVALSRDVLDAWHANPSAALPVFCDDLPATLMRHYGIVRRMETFIVLRPLGPGEAPSTVEDLFRK